MAVDTLGTSVKRREDLRFITGEGRYLDDLKLPGMTYLAILRSPYAHANIRSIDTSGAKAMPGVVAVLTGADVPYNPLPMAWPAGGSSGIVNNINMPRVLATDSVKWTGEGVAAVIAETPEQAADALESIVVDWEPLPAVVDAEAATQPGAPQLHENAPNNIVFVWPVGDKAGTDAAFEKAQVVVRQRIVNQRLIPNPMEVRGDIGRYDPGTDEYTVWMSSQTPHIQRLLLAAFVTGIPEQKIRCISPDVGGAFGSKIFCYADMALVMLASKTLGGRPVKWVESRRENYQSTIHGRDHITYLEVAATREGEVTGLRVKTFANLGGRLSTIGPGIPTTLYGRVLGGPYKIPNVYCEVTGVYTNTTFVDAYRGAGRPEATYVLERAMDLLADEIGMDPAAVRRKNFLPNDAFPYENPSGLTTAVNGEKIFIDSGDYEPALNKALTMAGYYEIDKAKAEAKKRGKLLGIGLSTYIEVCGVAPSKWIGAVGEGWGAAMWESANIKVHLTGQGRRHGGHPAAGPGPRDDLRPGHRPRARRRHRRRRRPALGHPGDPVRLRHVRQPDRDRRHGRRHEGDGQDQGQGPPDGRPHARGLASRTSRSTAPSTGSRARPTRRRRSRRSRSRSTSASTCRPTPSRTSMRPRITTPRTAPGRSGPTSRSSRSMRRPGSSTSLATSRSTTSARRSTR